MTQLWGRGVAHIYAFEPSPPRPPTCRKYSVAQSAERIQPTRPQPQPPSPSSVPIPPTPQRRRPDPFLLLAPQLSELRLSLLSLLESGHPVLSEITRYYFLHPSKQIRPLIILLFSHATNGLGRQWDRKLWEATCEGAGGAKDELDRPLTRPDVLNDWNPSMPENTTNFCQTFSPKPGKPHRPAVPKYHQPLTAHPPTTTPAVFPAPTYVLPTQMRLAQIVEMMHTASLLHDDVIDSSPLRRGSPSAPTAFGNKLSILGGNFVLGRASAALSRLGDAEVTDLIASVISNLVEGEILQMKEMKMGEGEGEEEVMQPIPSVGGQRTGDAWRVYLQKTYLKTASLMAKGARAAVTLGGCKEGDIWREIAYAYGRNLGIAFQVCVLAIYCVRPGFFFKKKLNFCTPQFTACR